MKQVDFVVTMKTKVISIPYVLGPLKCSLAPDLPYKRITGVIHVEIGDYITFTLYDVDARGGLWRQAGL